LKDDPVYQERLEQGLIKLNTGERREILPTAKRATYIFLGAIVFVVLYAAAISGSVGLIENPTLGRNEAIMTVMLGAAAVIVLTTKIDAAMIPAAATFRSGM
ncbi:anaerobic C4-dicarboxylate transporter family protein, partial [Vibrio lentus]